MKLTISQNLKPIDIDSLEVQTFEDNRVVHIDDKLVPDNLAKIILLGMDVATSRYLDLVEKAMKG